MAVSDIRIISRASQGVRLINLEKRDEEIASVCKVISEKEMETIDEKAEKEAREDAEIPEILPAEEEDYDEDITGEDEDFDENDENGNIVE
jgi:DNA gyrase subunit A